MVCDFICFIFFIATLSTSMGTEIDPEVDFDSRRAAYFRQMRYGLFVSSFALFQSTC
jgi:aspartate carbamoyltransferase catalytic subunit